MVRLSSDSARKLIVTFVHVVLLQFEYIAKDAIVAVGDG
jgi:hypothetical protein